MSGPHSIAAIIFDHNSFSNVAHDSLDPDMTLYLMSINWDDVFCIISSVISSALGCSTVHMAAAMFVSDASCVITMLLFLFSIVAGSRSFLFVLVISVVNCAAAFLCLSVHCSFVCLSGSRSIDMRSAT